MDLMCGGGGSRPCMALLIDYYQLFLLTITDNLVIILWAVGRITQCGFS